MYSPGAVVVYLILLNIGKFCPILSNFHHTAPGSYWPLGFLNHIKESKAGFA
jgi:hypothetical protein